MLLALALLAAGPETAIDAERAFNRAAQTQGQWAAFRAYSTDDALWFTPQPAKVHETLPDKEPKIAVQWWPAESYVSCDGSVAVNTGPWVRPKGVGYFTTVWVRQADGAYKWVYDGGDALSTPRALPEKPKVLKASCGASIPELHHAPCPAEVKCAHGMSADRSLHWDWQVDPDGARWLRAELWDGADYKTVVHDQIAASPP